MLAPPFRLNGLSKHYTAGCDNGQVGHAPLDELIYCERQVVLYMYLIGISLIGDIYISTHKMFFLIQVVLYIHLIGISLIGDIYILTHKMSFLNLTCIYVRL